MNKKDSFNQDTIRIYPCSKPEHWKAAKTITNIYFDYLGIDLSFQNIQAEMNQFETEYYPPNGCYLIAKINTFLAGGGGFRKWDENICEMKRLYVFDEFREKGIGKKLCAELINFAKSCGYKKMRLDTLLRLEKANALYKRMGFYDIPPYRENPLEDARFLEISIW